jgi:hypothetical protein
LSSDVLLGGLDHPVDPCRRDRWTPDPDFCPAGGLVLGDMQMPLSM